MKDGEQSNLVFVYFEITNCDFKGTGAIDQNKLNKTPTASITNRTRFEQVGKGGKRSRGRLSFANPSAPPLTLKCDTWTKPIAD